jgi:hypothetical protein
LLDLPTAASLRLPLSNRLEFLLGVSGSTDSLQDRAAEVFP